MDRGSMMAAGSGLKPSWKRHIVRQLRARDQRQQTPYTELFQAYNKLMEKSSLLRELTNTLQTDPSLADQARRFRAGTSGSSFSEDPSALRREIENREHDNGKVACEAYDLKNKVHEQEDRLAEQNSSVKDLCQTTATLCAQRDRLKEKVQLSEDANAELKSAHDQLLCHCQEADKNLREEELRKEELIKQMTKKKAKEAENQNRINERLQTQIWRRHCKEALRKTFSEINQMPEPGSPRLSASLENVRNGRERSRSVPSDSSRSSRVSRVFSTFRKLFDFSSSREPEDYVERWYQPASVCVMCCLPSRMLCSKEVHDSEIHAVKFSPNSRYLATGGTDRVVKLWDVSGGTFQEQLELRGCCGGITSIEFDPYGSFILAASFDGAAHLWTLDGRTYESLTRHGKKVTAAKFKMSRNHVVTGGMDRTVKEWDVQKAACTRSISVPSYCSDVVCSNSCIISSHWDKTIRFWDSRSDGCIKEVKLEDKVTSLFLNQDEMQLLTCSRDDVLSLVDLRMGNVLQEFRACGFKCGCDWTKAIMSPDGSYAIVGSVDGSIYIWNVLSGLLETRLNGEHRASVNGISWSTSGFYVVSVDRGKKAVLWTPF